MVILWRGKMNKQFLLELFESEDFQDHVMAKEIINTHYSKWLNKITPKGNVFNCLFSEVGDTDSINDKIFHYYIVTTWRDIGIIP